MSICRFIFIAAVMTVITVTLLFNNLTWSPYTVANAMFTANYDVNHVQRYKKIEATATSTVSKRIDISAQNSDQNGFYSQHLFRLTEKGKKTLPYKNNFSTLNGTKLNSTKLPIVLEWSNFYGLSLFEDPESLNNYCPYHCDYSTDQKLLNVAAVTLHHMGKYTNVIPNKSSKNQSFINIFLNFEPPPHRLQYKKSKAHFFDATITYRQDSTIPIYHDSLVPLDGPEDTDRWSDSEVEAAVILKQKTALWMVSHCKTYSERETYVAALTKHMNITQIGKCNKKKCPMFEDCEKELIKTHYFYIAFENSVCLDYITEKFFRLRQLIVPIVLDRRIFRGTHERLLNYTIVASDFESPKHLAEHLHYLIAHPDEYIKYFEWTKIYKKSPQPFYTKEAACKVCEIAHQAQNGTFVKGKLNIQKWWGENICYDRFGSTLASQNKTAVKFWNGVL